MNPVAEFMGDGGDVTACAIITAQHIRVMARRPGRTEGPAPLSGAYFGVNPAFAEEIVGNRRKLFAEPSESRQDQLPGLSEGNLFRLGLDRRVQVGVFQFF